MAAAELLNETPEQRLEHEVLEWTESVYDEAERELSDSKELKLTGKLIDYIEGRQWSPQARFGRSRPVENRFVRQFIEMVGQLTDILPDFKVTFHDHPEGFSELESLLNQYISLWAENTDFEGDLSQTVIYGLLHTGYGKVQWNPALANGYGDNEYIPISPVNLMEVGTDNKLKEAECVIYRVPVTLQYLKRRYGSIADFIKPDSNMQNQPAQMMRPAKMSASQWSKLPKSLQNMLGQKKDGMIGTKYPIALMKEFWFKDDSQNESSTSFRVGPENANWSYIVEPGMPIYPRGRLVVSAGRKILADSCNPYWHGNHPFAKYRPYRMPWSSKGLSALEPMAAIQNILNRINGGVMDTVNAAIEPTLIAPKAAFSDQSWDSMDPGAPGGKLRYNNNTPKIPEFRKPPELASYVLAVKQGLEKEQDMSSGSAAIQQSLQKKQVPSGDSLDMILNSKSVNIRLMGKNLKSYLTEVGAMTAANIMQFSPVKRRAQLFGGTGILDSDFTKSYGEMKPAGMEPEEFVRSMSFSIRKLNMAAERSEDLTIAFGLRKNKDISRTRLLLKLDPNFDIKQNEQELLAEAMQAAGVQGLIGAAGGGHHGGKK